ncbi:MAG: FAD-dependent oxidoreductase [Clostridia bacterium]|nr:FAD-dependent oxidoreductase [Clostridia bacterium]
MRKSLVFILICALLFASGALAVQASYTGVGAGNNGEVMVETVLEDGVISEVRVVEHSETVGICDAAIERIPKAIVDNQTLAVDTVSGATNTSNAILAAVASCLEQAGLNLVDYQTAVVKADVESEVINLSTDIVVVGAGGAGLSAAVAAAEAGRNVIVLEKLAAVGGSTGMSGGALTAATDNCEEFDEEESEKFATWLIDTAKGQGNAEIIRQVANSSNETILWLREMGVNLTPYDYPVAGESFAIYSAYTDFEGNSISSPAYIIRQMALRAEELGCKILTETPAQSLATDENGAVTGVVATDAAGNTLNIQAGKVILACGGFVVNQDMMIQANPKLEGVTYWNGAGNTGDGIVMATAIGAKRVFDPIGAFGIWESADFTNFPRNSSADLTYKTLIINDRGERFMNEGEPYGYQNLYRGFMLQKMDGCETFYALIDQNAFTEAGEATFQAGNAVKADTLDELAEAIGVDAETLKSTCARYTQLAGQEDEDFGKAAEFMTGMSADPFYAIEVGPLTLSSIGGLVIDAECRILNENSEPIENLYGAGELVNSAIFYEKYSKSGMAVQFVITTGRIAGANAAA